MAHDEEEIVEYVYLPNEGIYGTVIRYGAWFSLIEYYDGGFKYTIEVPNDEYETVNEIGIGYVSEEEQEEDN